MYFINPKIILVEHEYVVRLELAFDFSNENRLLRIIMYDFCLPDKTKKILSIHKTHMSIVYAQ